MGDTKVMTTSKLFFYYQLYTLVSEVYSCRIYVKRTRELETATFAQEVCITKLPAPGKKALCFSLIYACPGGCEFKRANAKLQAIQQKENCVLANCGAETLDQGQLSKTIKSLNPEPYLLTIGAAFDSEEIEEAIHQMERKLFREIPAEKCRASMSELSLSYANYDLNEDIEIQSCEPKNNKEMVSALVLTFFIVGLGVCIFVTMRIYCNLRQDLNSSREKLSNLKSSKEDCLLAEETLSYNST